MAEPTSREHPVPALETFRFRFPSSDEEDREKSFTVIKNYVASIALFLRDVYGPYDDVMSELVRTQRERGGFGRLGPHPIEGDSLERFLHIAWASEMQLGLGSVAGRDTLRYSNVWAPVHAYYAIYMSLQAWFAVNGMAGLVDDHTSSLRTISNMVLSRDLFPAPWNVTCSGCLQLEQPSFSGVPSDATPWTPFEVLSRPTLDTFWPRYCKMLETTRRQRLERNFKEWKKSRKRKTIRKLDKMSVAKNLLATTMFDFFWRLRVRSNYRDVSSFLAWNVSDPDHDEFQESLALITDATCTLVQNLLIPTVGADVYEELSSAFLGSGQGSRADLFRFLERRQRILLDL